MLALKLPHQSKSHAVPAFSLEGNGGDQILPHLAYAVVLLAMKKVIVFVVITLPWALAALTLAA